ncbi:MAG: VPLPA-CTERM sorting domain-containing protein [Halioglobus sp.]|nr:VPLPA-CTERM sorting domain-containing protein [Halioglobus sp.]
MNCLTKRLLLTASIGLFGLGASASHAVMIDFDDLADATIVTNQYRGVVFSAEVGNVITFSRVPYNGASEPSVISVDVTPGFGTVILDFTLPVNNLMFVVVGLNAGGDIGDVSVTHAGGFSIVDMIGIGRDEPIAMDLSAYLGVSRIAIGGITDERGVGYDNFSFDVQAVPLPAAAWLFGSALLGLAGLARRKS